MSWADIEEEKVSKETLTSNSQPKETYASIVRKETYSSIVSKNSDDDNDCETGSEVSMSDKEFLLMQYECMISAWFNKQKNKEIVCKKCSNTFIVSDEDKKVYEKNGSKPTICKLCKPKTND